MAGEYYNLEEVIEKLGKTENEIKELVREGKLREFRDGSKLLFKVDEVDGYVAEAALSAEVDDDLEIEGLDSVENMDLESGIELLLEDEGQNEKEAVEEEDLQIPDNEINLGELTGADTNITSLGINVLADTDDAYKIANDTKAETQQISGLDDEIEQEADELGDLADDINLDSVGSGSGLLDLSLQADDTSLGAVLDDILPAAGEAGEAAVGEGDMAEEADKIFEQAGQGGQMPVNLEPAPSQAAAMWIEPEPDASSNACGISLLIPFLALIYAAIILFAGVKGITPGLLEKTAGKVAGITLIWIVSGVLAVLALAIAGIGSMMGGGEAKPAKAKKVKPPKVKKEKKVKVKKEKKKKGKKGDE